MTKQCLTLLSLKLIRAITMVIKYSSFPVCAVFIIDSGMQIFVWVGKGASLDEKKRAMEFGHVSRNDEHNNDAAVSFHNIGYCTG